METQTAPKTARLHPLVAIAAISVTLASLAAVAVLTGVMPGSHADSTPPAAPLAAVQPATTAAPEAPVAAVPPAATVPPPAAVVPAAPAHEGKVVHRSTTKHAANVPPPPPASVPPMAAAEPPAAPPPPACVDCGTVESVRPVVVEGQGTGVGAVAGGVLGGVLGHQIGRGRGNDAATVLGAVGGAFAGHQIEKSQRTTTHYEITVRMNDGSYRTVTAKEQPVWRTGDHVRIENGAVVPGGQTY